MIVAGKIAGGAIFVGLASGAIAGSYHYLTSESTYFDLLNSETPSRRLITTTDKNTETEAWKKYKENNDGKGGGQDAWKLKDWNTKKGETNTLESLITECSNKTKDKARNKQDQKYKQFLSWCSVTK
ncbi:hypothetical protein A6V39_00660 [Candidatus Mycoplasma haematobovis]|uniref:Uncharacterized protein n=1 Tax=Candidatus Mycoplasma haematobovis TaxID=432608 RepID=A0A1A9QD94_9MOLU|nr:hypothetical protein [Candidatus Mycoplasma haematobovis]OAL10562.1 hypothetical protein A6V39_00660 [Candidatus Mycoplasma haematobovis]